MKLNLNCIRDCLLFVEENLVLDESLSWPRTNLHTISEKLSKYSKTDIAYTLYMLEEAGYIKAGVMNGNGKILDISITRLTYQGHEFLDTIRSNKVWQKVCSAISSVGSASLPIIQDVASNILITLLKSS